MWFDVVAIMRGIIALNKVIALKGPGRLLPVCGFFASWAFVYLLNQQGVGSVQKSAFPIAYFILIQEAMDCFAWTKLNWTFF